jgi:DNA-binding NtrC family response regulator
MIYRIPAQIDELIDDLSSNSTAYLQGGNGTLVSHLEDKLDTWNIDHLIACPVLQLIENPVADDYVMLLQGEPGSGKQLIAQMAHEKSQFTEGLFLTLNAAELDSKSLEIELKSIERGQILMQLVQYSITRGNLASLTLYIDELARLTPEAQESVLALIRRGSSFPQGSSSLRQDINIPIRVILATRYGFASLEDEFEMNEDLLFQLRTQTLRIPPLRERVGDIPALAKAIVKYLALSQGLATIPRIRNDAMERLLMYSWPGNIRELRKVLCHAVMRSEDGEITRSRLQFSGEFGCIEPVDGPSLGGLPLRELERRAIEETLVLCRGNKAEAARHLGISERGIYNKIKQLGIVSELRDRSDS